MLFRRLLEVRPLNGITSRSAALSTDPFIGFRDECLVFASLLRSKRRFWMMVARLKMPDSAAAAARRVFIIDGKFVSQIPIPLQAVS